MDGPTSGRSEDHPAGPIPGGSRPRIGIVGAGFTGSMLAVHLLRRADVELHLIERSTAIGKGLAYSTQNPRHLLNVRVANMSAFDDDPAHFLKWLWAKDWTEHPASSIPPSGHGFVSRRIFGAYIEELLQETIRAQSDHTRLIIHNQAAVSLARGAPVALSLADGTSLALDRVVLCVGNFPPAPTPGLPASAVQSRRYIADPWDGVRLAEIGAADDVLIIGSGLTMVDVMEWLLQQRHAGRIEVISRRGLAPHRHEPTRTYPRFLDESRLPRSVLALLRRVRAELRVASSAGFEWRSVLDSLRPLIRAIWLALPPAERRRFLRHLRPFWEIHRHRLAPTAADNLTRLRESGQLTIRAGRIRGVDNTEQGYRVALAPRGADASETIEVGWIVNCSGPQCDYESIPDPLVRSLLGNGIARHDALNLGLDVTNDHALIGADGGVSPVIFALGPPTKGTFWEITAVPDIRTACDRFATQLIGSLRALGADP